MSSGDVVLSTTKHISTMPNRIAWLMASLISAIRRNTRKLPISAHDAATTAAIRMISI
jgi:hypothetical protein